MHTLLAHTDEPVAEATSSGLLDSLAHQPAWAAFLISIFILVSIYAILSLFKLKLINKLFALMPAIIALSILFVSHNPIVATILLSGGFIMTFVLAFALLRTHK